MLPWQWDCILILENACMHAIVVGQAWEGVVRITKYLTLSKSKHLAQMQEGQNAMVHGLVLVSADHS